MNNRNRFAMKMGFGIFILFVNISCMKGPSSQDLVSINELIQNQYRLSNNPYLKNDTLIIDLKVDFQDIVRTNRMKLLRLMIIYDTYEYLKECNQVVFIASAKQDNRYNEVHIYTGAEVKNVLDLYNGSTHALSFNRFILNEITSKELSYYDSALKGVLMYARDSTYPYDFIETVWHYCDDLDMGVTNSDYLSKLKQIKIAMKDNNVVPKDVDVTKLDFFIENKTIIEQTIGKKKT